MRLRPGGPTLAVALVIAAMAANALARPGKVIRVEREKVKRDLDIAVCETRGSRITCYGPVEPGDDLHGLDEDGGYRHFVVNRVAPSQDDRCKTGVPVDVSVSGPMLTGASKQQLALRGIDPRPGKSRTIDRTRLKAPDQNNQQVLLGVDLAGDGVAEILATMRSCEDVRRRTPKLSGRPGHSFCVTFWRRDRATDPWEQDSEVALHFCR
jgi:hypothetical protein